MKLLRKGSLKYDLYLRGKSYRGKQHCPFIPVMLWTAPGQHLSSRRCLPRTALQERPKAYLRPTGVRAWFSASGNPFGALNPGRGRAKWNKSPRFFSQSQFLRQLSFRSISLVSLGSSLLSVLTLRWRTPWGPLRSGLQWYNLEDGLRIAFP